MSTPDLYEVAFEWPHPEPNTVIVTGTFDEWSCSVPLVKTPTGFVGSTKIPYGEKIKFKYVVDGKWVLHEDQATETDPGGFVNHVFTAPPALVKAVKPAPAAEPENGKVAVAEAETTKAEEAPATNGHAVNGHSEAAMEEDKPATDHAEEAQPAVAKESETDGDESKQKDAAGSTSGFPQMLSDIADTIAARDGTSSALGYVASGLGAVMHSVVGVDPINVQPISIPTPAVETGFELPAGQEAESAAPATTALPDESAPSAAAVDSSDSIPSPIAPRVPIMIVPVNAAENNTLAPPDSEIVSPIPVIDSTKPAADADASAESPAITEPDVAAAVVAPAAIVADAVASEKAEPVDAEVAEPVTAAEPPAIEPVSADAMVEDAVTPEVVLPSKEEVEALEAAAPAPIGSTPAIIAAVVEDAPAKEAEPAVEVGAIVAEPETPAEVEEPLKEAEVVPAIEEVAAAVAVPEPITTEVPAAVPVVEEVVPADEVKAEEPKTAAEPVLEEPAVVEATPAQPEHVAEEQADKVVADVVAEAMEPVKADETKAEEKEAEIADPQETKVEEGPASEESTKASEPVEEVVMAEVPAEEAPAPVPVKNEPEAEMKKDITEATAAAPLAIVAVVPDILSEPDVKDVAADAALAQEFLATTELKEIPVETTKPASEEIAAAPAVAAKDKKEDIAAVVVPIDADQVVAVPTEAAPEAEAAEPTSAAIVEEARPTEEVSPEAAQPEKEATSEVKPVAENTEVKEVEPAVVPKVAAAVLPAVAEEKTMPTTNGTTATTEAKKDFQDFPATTSPAATESPSSSKYNSQRKKRTSLLGKIKQIFHHDHKDKEKK